MSLYSETEGRPKPLPYADEKGVLSADDFVVSTLGECTYETTRPRFAFVDDKQRVLLQSHYTPTKPIDTSLAFEVAGQRERMFFDPHNTIVGIVTCGGLCPGLNDVVRALTYASLNYNVKKVLGYRYGYHGLSKDGHPPVKLESRQVNTIHDLGGTVLGSSRGPIPAAEMVETLKRDKINILFTIGGDGTQRGAQMLFEEITRQKLPIAVVGIPKTIDNDILYISRTFGFDTAVEQARVAISCAHAEAQSADNGIGLVKLMGRDSGFIAAKATLASGDVNICLIPEEPFTLPSLMANIENRLVHRGHCVIVVAEGAGVDILKEFNSAKTDSSGNTSYGDIGMFLKSEITSYFKKTKLGITIKYIDPSYTIRSIKPTSADAAFCEELGNKAVDSAMCGKTGCIVGYWGESFTLVPMKLIARGRKKVDVKGHMWNTVKQMTWTMQPIGGKDEKSKEKEKEKDEGSELSSSSTCSSSSTPSSAATHPPTPL